MFCILCARFLKHDKTTPMSYINMMIVLAKRDNVKKKKISCFLTSPLDLAPEVVETETQTQLVQLQTRLVVRKYIV